MRKDEAWHHGLRSESLKRMSKNTGESAPSVSVETSGYWIYQVCDTFTKDSDRCGVEPAWGWDKPFATDSRAREIELHMPRKSWVSPRCQILSCRISFPLLNISLADSPLGLLSWNENVMQLIFFYFTRAHTWMTRFSKEILKWTIIFWSINFRFWGQTREEWLCFNSGIFMYQEDKGSIVLVSLFPWCISHLFIAVTKYDQSNLETRV